MDRSATGADSRNAIGTAAPPKCMVMERMVGVPISQVDRLRRCRCGHSQAGARWCDDVSSPRCFGTGFSMPTCTPATSRSALDPTTFGRYISLDFGIVGTLTEVDKEYLAQKFHGLLPARLQARGRAAHRVRLGAARTRVWTSWKRRYRGRCASLTLTGRSRRSRWGMVLMRLFQTSRRFQVEIQPQLVLLQKTLLNIEGLGRRS